MSQELPSTIHYKRARFKTSLPVDRLYSQAHYWLADDGPGACRVGLTKFATRMLGDFVELNFDVNVGERVELGQPIGSIEGFKAVSEVYSVAAGRFAGGNAALEAEPSLLERHPYDAGWLYRLDDCQPEGLIDVHGYIDLLNATIDRMLEQQQQQKEKSC